MGLIKLFFDDSHLFEPVSCLSERSKLSFCCLSENLLKGGTLRLCGVEIVFNLPLIFLIFRGLFVAEEFRGDFHLKLI